MTLRFLPKLGKDSSLLRDGTVDLETGVIDDETAPEVRAHTLFEDHLVGVVRVGHPLTKDKVTAKRYAAGEHIGVSRRMLERGPIDAALQRLGLERRVVAVVGGFATAIALAAHSDLVATVPKQHSGVLLEPMHEFAVPGELPKIKGAMGWHPRVDGDAGHRWRRESGRSAGG